MRILGLIFFLFAAVYLIWPTPGIPIDPPSSLLSSEPADTESIYRHSFYTNFSRSELMDYYRREFRGSGFPIIRLDQPPEFAYELIRDQTRSSWLEELAHPFKDSLYINGYYPTKPTDQITKNDTHYAGQITVRYLPSHPLPRLTILLLSALCLVWLLKEYRHV